MTIKSQIKNATRKAKQATPKVKPTSLAKVKANKTVQSYHALIVADFKAMQSAGRAGLTEYQAFKAVLLAVNLSSNTEIKSAQADIKKTFGEASADAATMRCTMLNNAKKVEFGAVVDKHQIKGAGRAALVKAIESVTSIRELRKAIAAAKPAALKDSRGGVKKPAPVAKPKAVKGLKHIADGLDIPENKADAIAAAVKVLEFVATNYLTLSTDSIALTSTYATIKLLKAA